MTLLERLGGRETVTRGIVDTFRAISRPPHPSGQEGAAADAVAALLSGLGLGTERDGAGNLLCRVPAAPGREGAPELVLQGHLDMVCAAAPGSGWNPQTDPVTVVEADVLAVPEAAVNGPRRCYYCKKALFTTLWKRAAEDGYTVLLDGTNASDDAGDRPGMQALRELEVRSPLRECGITKDQVRQMSKEAGLFTWDKPAYACLATRVPTGTAITREALEKVERGEDALFKLGFTDFRVRLMGDAARIQLPEAQMERAVQLHDTIAKALERDFSAVLLDLKGR